MLRAHLTRPQDWEADPTEAAPPPKAYEDLLGMIWPGCSDLPSRSRTIAKGEKVGAGRSGPAAICDSDTVTSRSKDGVNDC